MCVCGEIAIDNVSVHWSRTMTKTYKMKIENSAKAVNDNDVEQYTKIKTEKRTAIVYTSVGFDEA